MFFTSNCKCLVLPEIVLIQIKSIHHLLVASGESNYIRWRSKHIALHDKLSVFKLHNGGIYIILLTFHLTTSLCIVTQWKCLSRHMFTCVDLTSIAYILAIFFSWKIIHLHTITKKEKVNLRNKGLVLALITKCINTSEAGVRVHCTLKSHIEH